MSIPLYIYSYHGTPARATWQKDMGDLLRKYLADEPIYVQFDSSFDVRRTGAIGRLVIKNMQDILHGSVAYRHSRGRSIIKEVPKNVDDSKIGTVNFDCEIVWDGRKNKCQAWGGHGLTWLKDRTAEEGTYWVWEKPEVPVVVPTDKLGREIKKGDFISYILYHFDNNYNAAGIYYGKVTNIEADGTVWATNIKLSEDDRVADKKIKDNSLIVIMTKDLMDKLMMARLSIL